MPDLSKQDLIDAFEKYFGGGKIGTLSSLDTKATKEYIESIKASTKVLKDSLPASKQFVNSIKGMPGQFVDVSDELKRLEESIVKAREANQDELAEELDRQKIDKLKTAATINAKVAVQNFGIGVAGVLGTVVTGAVNFAKGLQSGGEGVEVGTKAAVDAARASGEAAGVAGGLISSVGGIMGMFSGKIKWVGTALTVLGEVLGVFGKKSAEFAGEAAQFLGDELTKTKKAYKEVTDTGAMLAGGMTELRERAADAGLDVAQFANAIKNSREELSMMGLGLGEGAKRMGAVNKELRNSQFGTQLQKLGYSMEEQAQLTAQVMANNNAAGEKRRLSDQEVARQTAEYGKSLKILSDITGEDAKKAMEKARMQAMEADLMAQAMAEGGPEAVKKLQAQLATMPEALKKGYMEFVSTGGSAVADAATNVAITQNPKIMEQYRQQYNDLSNGAVDQKRALENTGRYTEQTGKYALENMENTKQVGLAARMTGDALTGGATNIANGLIVAGTKLKEGATDAASKATEGAAVNTAPLDQAVTALEADTQKLKAAMTNELTPAITSFAGQLQRGIGTVKEALDKLGIRTKEKTTGEKVGGLVGGGAGMVGGGMAGAASGAALGSLVGPIGTLVGGIIGGAIGSWGGGEAGASVGEWAGAKFALGGIVNKPTRALIGEAGMSEAVIPMPDGKTIPVQMTGENSDMSELIDVMKKLPTQMAGGNSDMTELVEVMKTFISKQSESHTEMIAQLRDHKDISQKLFNAMS